MPPSNISLDIKILTWIKNVLKKSENQPLVGIKAIAQTPWSNVFEINTGKETLYLKQTPAEFSLEPTIIRFFKDKLHAHVPEIIADNSDLYCFLMKHSGDNLRKVLKQEFKESLVITTVEQFSTIQVSASKYVDFLLNMGVPDYTLAQLPPLYHHLIKQTGLLSEEGFTHAEIDYLHTILPKIVKICNKLSDYNIKKTVVQLDFSDNNTLIDTSRNKVTIIDLGEIVISHPFFSLLNFLSQMKKHYGLTEEGLLYQRLKNIYFSQYRHCFAHEDRFHEAFALAKKAHMIFMLTYQDRFIKTCGKENLKTHTHWKLGSLLRNLMSQAYFD